VGALPLAAGTQKEEQLPSAQCTRLPAALCLQESHSLAKRKAEVEAEAEARAGKRQRLEALRKGRLAVPRRGGCPRRGGGPLGG
jgi:hypothetical protein